MVRSRPASVANTITRANADGQHQRAAQPPAIVQDTNQQRPGGGADIADELRLARQRARRVVIASSSVASMNKCQKLGSRKQAANGRNWVVVATSSLPTSANGRSLLLCSSFSFTFVARSRVATRLPELWRTALLQTLT